MTEEPTEDDGTTFGLVLSFSGLYQTMPEEHAFVHGVEFGGLWAAMTAGQAAEIEKTVHTVNREIIERAAVSQGWVAEFKTTTIPEWLECTLTKTASAKPNPHGLRVVSN